MPYRGAAEEGSVATVVGAAVDPVKYEVFLHRLWAIGEEGRIALQRVTASPIVAQGGECMSSFYAPDGTMILACSGTSASPRYLAGDPRDHRLVQREPRHPRRRPVLPE